MHVKKVPSRVLLIALAAGATSVAAQPPGPPLGGTLMDIDRLAVLLDLDAYQKQEVGRILDEQRQAGVAQRQAVASGERPSFEEMEARRQEMEHELLTKLQAVLTEAQIEKFKVLAERPRRRRPGPNE